MRSERDEKQGREAQDKGRNRCRLEKERRAEERKLRLGFSALIEIGKKDLREDNRSLHNSYYL